MRLVLLFLSLSQFYSPQAAEREKLNAERQLLQSQVEQLRAVPSDGAQEHTARLERELRSLSERLASAERQADEAAGTHAVLQCVAPV